MLLEAQTAGATTLLCTAYILCCLFDWVIAVAHDDAVAGRADAVLHMQDEKAKNIL